MIVSGACALLEVAVGSERQDILGDAGFGEAGEDDDLGRGRGLSISSSASRPVRRASRGRAGSRPAGAVRLRGSLRRRRRLRRRRAGAAATRRRRRAVSRIASLSSQIRTPMAVVGGFASSLIARRVRNRRSVCKRYAFEPQLVERAADDRAGVLSASSRASRDSSRRSSSSARWATVRLWTTPSWSSSSCRRCAASAPAPASVSRRGARTHPAPPGTRAKRRNVMSIALCSSSGRLSTMYAYTPRLPPRSIHRRRSRRAARSPGKTPP